jgi:hypothetical protein
MKRLTYHAREYRGDRPLYFQMARGRNLSLWQAILNLILN